MDNATTLPDTESMLNINKAPKLNAARQEVARYGLVADQTMNEAQVKALETGDRVIVKGWHESDRHVGVVERVTKTQVIVIQDFSFQGGNRRESKFRRLNSEGRSYGAGLEIGGGTMSKHLEGRATDEQVRVYTDACQAKHRQSMTWAAAQRHKERTLAELQAMVPADCYVQHNSHGSHDEDTYSITIGALKNPEAVVKYAQEISRLVVRLSRA